MIIKNNMFRFGISLLIFIIIFVTVVAIGVEITLFYNNQKITTIIFYGWGSGDADHDTFNSIKDSAYYENLTIFSRKSFVFFNVLLIFSALHLIFSAVSLWLNFKNISIKKTGMIVTDGIYSVIVVTSATILIIAIATIYKKLTPGYIFGTRSIMTFIMLSATLVLAISVPILGNINFSKGEK